MEKNGTMELMKTSEILGLYPSAPSFQRLVDQQRVDEFYSSIESDIKNKNPIILPGCIIITKNDEKYWISDGLHRLGAYTKILTTLNVDLKCYCNTFVVADEAEAKQIFERVNNTRMLPTMPEGININTVKTVVDYFQRKYPKIFSNSKSGRCVRPHIHFNGFQESLGKMLLKYPYFKPSDIIGRIEDLNSKILDDDVMIETFDFKKYTDTARTKGGFYLGIIPSYGWLDIVFTNDIKQYKRQTIPSSVRNRVWVETNGENWNGKCYVCDCDIDVNSFHCGHDIAASKGGNITVKNLKPICSLCNLSMGTRTLNEMKEMLS